MQLTRPIARSMGNFFMGVLQMKKAMIFIDGSNVFYDWHKSYPSDNMDIAKYIETIKNKYSDVDFIRTYYFATESSTNSAFLQVVNRIPHCQVIKGRLQEKHIYINEKMGILCGKCGDTVKSGVIRTHTDKGTDVNIAVEMLRHGYSDSFDLAILISRDADFAGVVRIIKNLGKNVDLVLFESETGNAEELTDTVDRVLIFDANDCISCKKTP